jgi:hypothetical protein
VPDTPSGSVYDVVAVTGTRIVTPTIEDGVVFPEGTVVSAPITVSRL